MRLDHGPIDAPPSSPQKTSQRLDRLIRLAAACASAITTLIALYFALEHHVFLIAQEHDGYTWLAEQWINGDWPRDVYRPALYPLLTAAGSYLFGNCFTAGKIISCLATGGLVWLTYCLGLRMGRPPTALLGSLLCSTNLLVMPNGIFAATDMLFAFAFTLAVIATLRYVDRGSKGAAALMGGALALAYFTRYQGIALLPMMLATIATLSPNNTSRRSLAYFVAGAATGLIPHMAICLLQFGKPFHDENWRNLALRHYGAPEDWNYLNTNPFNGLLSVLRHDFSLIIAHTGTEFADFLRVGLPQVMGLAMPGMPIAVATVTLAVGAPTILLHNRKPAFVALAIAATYLGLLCFTFYSSHRFALPIVPIGSTVTACALGSILHPKLPASTLRHIAWASLALWLCSASGWRTYLEVWNLMDEQPNDIVAFTRNATKGAKTAPRVVSNYGPLPNYAPIDHFQTAIAGEASDCWKKLRAAALQHHADYVLCHKQEAWRIWDAFALQATPPDFELVAHTRVFRAYVPKKAAATLPAHVTISFSHERGSTVRAETRFHGEHPDMEIRLWMEMPDHQRLVLPMLPSAESCRSVSFEARTPGEWILRMEGKQPDGFIHVSDDYSMLVRPDGLPKLSQDDLEGAYNAREDSSNMSQNTTRLDMLLSANWDAQGRFIECRVEHAPPEGRVYAFLSLTPANTRITDTVTAHVSWPPLTWQELDRNPSATGSAECTLQLQPIPLGRPLYLQAAIITEDRVLLSSNGVRLKPR